MQREKILTNDVFSGFDERYWNLQHSTNKAPEESQNPSKPADAAMITAA
jgi:hypothetical protein